ncbi:ecto-ADP-ribosyltransferase 5-like [Rana temporaria]|uniref:ecto-ADP-ribosyltransferase 5-like n=1 Tax=Rana temporaria TaxID=8407 RepID=UPI001AAC8B51|nr:ecto-ADP-ribosyltransferase 5-like [Rana temporaria]XP_040195682.1 ecto-ADP-ribosyltransferase 5-like [Rana temporaria]
MRIKNFLAAIFCLLIGWEHVEALGDTYELKFKPNVFDDQYIGCVDKLNDDVMPRILRQEKVNQEFDEAWKRATKAWKKMVSKAKLPDEFEDEHGIALLVFTDQFPEKNPIYQQINANLTIAGASLKDYMDNFHFKALHFYLTRALQILKPDCRKPYSTFRGSWDTFEASPLFKFGRFTSTSLNSTKAKSFGVMSFFQITTCFGAEIGQFSFYPGEDEVLIPPTEKFTYVMKNDSTYVLESTGQLCSYFNCAIMGGEKKTEAICHSDSSKLKKIGNIKKNKVSSPLSELEERITALEKLAIRNHEQYDEVRANISHAHDEVKAQGSLTTYHTLAVRALATELEEVKSQMESSQNQQSPYAEVFHHTTNILNLLLKEELIDRRALRGEEEKLDRIRTKLDELRDFAWNTKLRLYDVENALDTDRTRVTDVQDSISHNLETVKTLREHISVLQASRDELQATMKNITWGLTFVSTIGTLILIKRFWSVFPQKTQMKTTVNSNDASVNDL